MKPITRKTQPDQLLFDIDHDRDNLYSISLMIVAEKMPVSGMGTTITDENLQRIADACIHALKQQKQER